MDIHHYDVDLQIRSYLSGKLSTISLHESSLEDTLNIEAISIKTISRASRAVLKNYPKLKLIITRTVGTDHIDLDYCKEHKIALYHILDYGSFNIAEHTFALLLSGCRNIVSSQKEIRNGMFAYSNHLGISLKGKTIGVVGTGRIGVEVIERARAFGMNVVAYDVIQNPLVRDTYQIPYLTLDELLKQSDIVTLHAPLLESTKHMINEHTIQLMKNGAILINTARGGLIDTAALIKHIQKYAFVGLDVLEDEQNFSKNHPLLQYDNVIITPHIAFFSDASVKKIAEETMKLFQNFLSGNTEGRVI